MPWVVVDGVDNQHKLKKTAWQAQVYGAARPELVARCADQKLALHTFPWAPEYAQAGLARDALYLLRPDIYVGWPMRQARPTCCGATFGVARRRIEPHTASAPPHGAPPSRPA